MKKKFLLFIVVVLLAAGLFFGARFLFARAFDKEMPVALSEHAIVAPSDAGAFVYDGGKLLLVDARNDIGTSVHFAKPKMIAVGKDVYIADGKTLTSYNRKLEKTYETTAPEEIRTLDAVGGTLYYGMKDQTVRFSGGEGVALSTPGYPVRLRADKDALVVLTVEDKDNHLKSRLYLFREGMDEVSFGFLDEVMEDAAFLDGHLYIVTNRAYYHFLDARLIEKDEIMRLTGTARDANTLLYLDDTRLVRIALADGTKTVTKIDETTGLVRAEGKTLLLGKRATVLTDDGTTVPALEGETVYGGFPYKRDLYLVTPKGIYRYFQK